MACLYTITRREGIKCEQVGCFGPGARHKNKNASLFPFPCRCVAGEEVGARMKGGGGSGSSSTIDSGNGSASPISGFSRFLLWMHMVVMVVLALACVFYHNWLVGLINFANTFFASAGTKVPGPSLNPGIEFPLHHVYHSFLLLFSRLAFVIREPLAWRLAGLPMVLLAIFDWVAARYVSTFRFP